MIAPSEAHDITTLVFEPAKVALAAITGVATFTHSRVNVAEATFESKNLSLNTFALTVVVSLTVNGPVYSALVSVGSLPSSM